MATESQLGFHCKDDDHRCCIEAALANAERLCKTRQQRFTSLRRRVLELVWRQHKPIGAYEVLELLRQNGRAAPPTVYRALDFLQQMGLVHRIASLNAYVGCAQPGEPHDGQFLICETCLSLAELDVPAISNAINRSAAASGFETRRQTIEIMGLCADCRRQEKLT